MPLQRSGESRKTNDINDLDATQAMRLPLVRSVANNDTAETIENVYRGGDSQRKDGDTHGVARKKMGNELIGGRTTSCAD